MPTPYSPGAGSVDSLARHLGAIEVVGDLDQDAGAVAHQAVGADRAAVVQVLEDLQTLGDDRVRLVAGDMGHEADAAGIVLVRRVVEARLRGEIYFAAGRHRPIVDFVHGVPRLCLRGRRIPQRSKYRRQGAVVNRFGRRSARPG